MNGDYRPTSTRIDYSENSLGYARRYIEVISKGSVEKMIHFIKRVLSVCFVLSVCIFVGCTVQTQDSSYNNEPGSARPVTTYYSGYIYSHDGHITYDIPDGFDFIGETNNVGNSPKTEDFAANEDGYLYKNIEDDELIYFQWKEWDESVDGGEEPYLLLYCKGSPD